MMVTFETAEKETTFDLRDWPVPRRGEYIDWFHTPALPDQLPVGLYCVERVTYLFTNGVVQIRLVLTLTKPH